jgi:hypothetical protein
VAGPREGAIGSPGPPEALAGSSQETDLLGVTQQEGTETGLGKPVRGQRLGGRGRGDRVESPKSTYFTLATGSACGLQESLRGGETCQELVLTSRAKASTTVQDGGDQDRTPGEGGGWQGPGEGSPVISPALQG